MSILKTAAVSGPAPQTGIWLGLASAYSAEIAATAGFGYWLLLDAEHVPNDLGSLLAQLQALAPYKSHPVVRPPTLRRRALLSAIWILAYRTY